MRQDDFQIIGGMQRVFMMLGVARPELMVIVQAQKTENAEEEDVERFGFEDRIVHQFVEAVDEKLPAGAVEIEQEDDERPRQSAGGEIGGRVSEGQECEITAGLEKTFEIAALVEPAKVFPVDAGAIPRDA